VAHRARSPGVEAIHDLGPAAERREGVAAADDLAERREVRPHAELALGTVRPNPERDDLVEDQDRADLGGHLAQRAEERRVGGPDAAGALDRFDDDRRELSLATGEGLLDPVGIAPRQVDDEVARRLWHAGRVGEDRVVGPVIRAVEPGDEVAAGERPGRPDREHRRLGAGVREPQPLDRRQAAPDLLGQLDLDLGRRGERRGPADLVGDRFDHRRMRVAEDQRGVVAKEVAVLVAVDVPRPEALAADHVRRVRRIEDGRPGRAARDRLRRPLEQLA